MKLFDRVMDWLEARPMRQIVVGVLLALALMIVVSETIR